MGEILLEIRTENILEELSYVIAKWKHLHALAARTNWR
jgi:hypothetical protein